VDVRQLLHTIANAGIKRLILIGKVINNFTWAGKTINVTVTYDTRVLQLLVLSPLVTGFITQYI